VWSLCSGTAPGDLWSVITSADKTELSGAAFAEDTGLTVDADLPEVECDQPTRIALLRCTQESLANVREHAAASAAARGDYARSGSSFTGLAGAVNREYPMDPPERRFIGPGQRAGHPQ
jgi:hypothetical protein